MIQEFLNEFTGIIEIYILTVSMVFLGLAFGPHVMEVPFFLLKGVFYYFGVLT